MCVAALFVGIFYGVGEESEDTIMKRGLGIEMSLSLRSKQIVSVFKRLKGSYSNNNNNNFSL